MADMTVVYTAMYDDVNAALADLDAIEQLHRDEMIGKFDAAVIDKEQGKPHIAKRVDHPGVRLIPEMFGGGPLPRKELEDAADELAGSDAGLIVVGEPTLDKGFDKAVTRAAKVAKHDFDMSTDDLAAAMTDMMKN